MHAVSFLVIDPYRRNKPLKVSKLNQLHYLYRDLLQFFQEFMGMKPSGNLNPPLFLFLFSIQLLFVFHLFCLGDSVVESVGEHVEEFVEGDMVLPVFLPNCGECRDCKSEKSNACSVFPNKFSPDMPRDGTSRFKDMKGEMLHHFLWVSSFTEYTVVDVNHTVKISPEIPADKACLLSCGVSTG